MKLSRILFTLCAALPATALAQDAKPETTPKPVEPAKAEGDTAAKETPKKAEKANDMALDQIKKFIAENGAKIDKSKSDWKTRLPMPPKVAFDANSDYFWTITTSLGEIKVKLLPATAPMHVSSTIYLTELGFYDGLVFHRVIPQFMAQGGCPLGKGMGGPGYKYDGEYDPKVKHDRGGLLSMANAGPGTDGSQFFLTFVATPWLDGKHTIFGEVVSGKEVLPELEKRGSQSGATKETLKMEKSKITIEPKAK
jgi:peptidyl-prolyl cis-trans isomerase B (cyclophilin B)